MPMQQQPIFVTNHTVHAIVGQIRVCPHEGAGLIVFDNGDEQMVVFEKDVKAKAFVDKVIEFNGGNRRIVYMSMGTNRQ